MRVDRTVAEAMGWYVDGMDEWYVDDWMTDKDEPAGIHLGPTPDDMLSWLREQGYGIEIGTAHNATEVGVEISRWDDWHEYTVTEDHYAPTLHAALGAAVLAVSAAQDVEQQGDDGEDDQNGGQHG